MAMRATTAELGKRLTATSAPRKIDLAEEMELLGVDVPQEISEAQPANEPVFLPYQQRWFEDEPDHDRGEVPPYRPDLG